MTSRATTSAVLTTKHAYEVVVIGAGPAGLAAATAAAIAGKRVAVLDDNVRAGGQIWRVGFGAAHEDRERGRVAEAFTLSGAELFSGRQVVDVPQSGELQAWAAERQVLETFQYDKLILATGARERFLPFPGWTLPGVFGVGGLQAHVRGGYDVRGKRVVVAGAGPLLLAVAAHLRRDGAEIVTVAEQTSMFRLALFTASLITRPRKILQGIHLRMELAGVPYRTGCWPMAVEGMQAITGVRLTDGSRTWMEPCELLACGFHLVPNTELASLLGCRIGADGVEVDADQQTSLAGVYCAGELTGIAGVDGALIEGEIAGLSAAGNTASHLHAKRDAEAAFGRAMARAFALRPELRLLPAPETIVCRCEDVRFADLKARSTPHGGWTDAKLQTRCGMGPCQGRICGPALETLFGWRNASVRPPLFPIPVAAMCSAPQAQEELSHSLSQETTR